MIFPNQLVKTAVAELIKKEFSGDANMQDLKYSFVN